MSTSHAFQQILDQSLLSLEVQSALSPIHTNNNVEATFDFVEATFDFVERIVRFVVFDNVASTLLPRCGRGFTLPSQIYWSTDATS